MKRHISNLIVFIFALTTCFSQDSKISTPKIEAEIDRIISEMTLAEKVGQTCQITLDVLLLRDSTGKTIEPLQIDPIKLKEAIMDYKIGSVLNVSWHTLTLKDWSRILKQIHEPFEKKLSKTPILYGIDAIHGVNYTVNGTLFPQEIGLAATWNKDLAYQFGEVVAYETRATGIHWNFSPVLDLGRQPLWSRNFETLGEDPFLASKMGSEIIKGYQGNGTLDAFHVAACMKHFVGYSNPTSGRDRTPAWIPEKYMQELYLPTFKSAVENGALTVMVNSGAVNGIPGHANEHLLTEVLKQQWGFQGFAVSDWEDFIMLHTVHSTASSKKEGIIQAINAGLDMSMVPLAPQYQEYCNLLKEAIEEGRISIERIDDAVRRILRVKLISGLYEKNMGNAKKYPKFGSDEHRELALHSALESITLLKNEKNVLPLNKNQKILISGPTSNNLIYLNGAWTHTWQGADTAFNTKHCYSIKEGLENFVGKEKVSFSQGATLFLDQGYEATRLSDTKDFEAKAKDADVIVLCLGEYPSTEKLGDIRSLNLNTEQTELVNIAHATGKPIVLIILEGRPRIIRDAEKMADAIVQAYLPGDFGSEAIVKLLYGEANFSGKLPFSYPKYDGQIEFYDHPKSVSRNKSDDFNAYNPQWDFGYGLSYSKFEYTDLQLSQKEISAQDSILISVQITNTSDRDGQEVVQLYIADEIASTIPTGKSLKGFEKIMLKAGETKNVTFVIKTKDLKFSNEHGEWIIEPGKFQVQIKDLVASFYYN